MWAQGNNMKPIIQNQKKSLCFLISNVSSFNLLFQCNSAFVVKSRYGGHALSVVALAQLADFTFRSLEMCVLHFDH